MTSKQHAVSVAQPVSTDQPASTTQPVSTAASAGPARDVWQAIGRGGRLRCPACGRGHMFHRYLKVADHCPACGEALHHQRADDAPPYMTILIVGHIVVPLLLTVERGWHPPEWVHAVLWLPLTLILALSILPVTKGGLIGLQWALRMHGFNGEPAEPHG